MTDVVAVQHVLAHGHGDVGAAGRDGLDLHAEAAHGAVAGEHGIAHAFGSVLGVGVAHRSGFLNGR